VSIKVFVADDKNVVRSVITGMLNADRDLEVIGEAATFEETLKLVSVQRPDVVVLDLHMPDEKIYAPEVVRLTLLQKAGCILAVSIWNDHDAKALAERFGAKALLDKAHLSSELIPAIKRFCVHSKNEQIDVERA
jgi:two-component system, NarL family, response regulator DevR